MVEEEGGRAGGKKVEKQIRGREKVEKSVKLESGSGGGNKVEKIKEEESGSGGGMMVEKEGKVSEMQAH